jgi:hypothetical protein
MYEYEWNEEDKVWDVFNQSGDYVRSFSTEFSARTYCYDKNRGQVDPNPPFRPPL